MNFCRKMIPNLVKPFARKLMWEYRQNTWSKRTLPDFIVIGAQKSGTTSLYHYLSQHPQLMPSYGKEIHFFDGGVNPDVDSFNKGQAWYRAHFSLKLNMRNDKKAFEASPLYIFNPLAAQRISKLIPGVKLIAILRNPIERAISHYFHEKRKGRETLPIMKALHSEEERLKTVIDTQDYKNDIFRYYSYKSRGRYHEQIERYLNYFQKSDILVINSEELFTGPNDTLRRIFQFVGVDTKFIVKDLKARNIGRNRIGVDPRVYKYLENYFRPYNEDLYNLIGRNYGW